MTIVQNVLEHLEEIAPYERMESWDNAGLLVGNKGKEVTAVLCALDVTKEVIEEALALRVELLVTHHPLIFQPMKSVVQDDLTGSLVMDLIRNDLSAICMHTNLDSAEDGVNDQLAQAIGLVGIENLGAGESGQLGRVGHFKEEMLLPAFLSLVKNRLGAEGIRFVDANGTVFRVAVGGGACDKLLDLALSHQADTFLVGEAGYHSMLDAKAKGLNLVDAGHFPTENAITKTLAKKLSARFPEIRVHTSKKHKNCIEFF